VNKSRFVIGLAVFINGKSYFCQGKSCFLARFENVKDHSRRAVVEFFDFLFAVCQRYQLDLTNPMIYDIFRASFLTYARGKL
jgi:hypothetical protein